LLHSLRRACPPNKIASDKFVCHSGKTRFGMPAKIRRPISGRD
jgi:hypothetical protein